MRRLLVIPAMLALCSCMATSIVNRPPASTLLAADCNRDGTYSLKELSAFDVNGRALGPTQFAAADRNRDQSLSIAELEAYLTEVAGGWGWTTRCNQL
jgi:hypothetical protein